MPTELFPAGAADVVYLVDLSSYLLRAYHAVAPLSSPSGEPTHAVHGMATMLDRLFRERKPALVGIAMDSGRATFRRDIFAEYKAHRPPAPDDLKVQLKRAEELVVALGLGTYKQDGVEADDLIATVSQRAIERGLRVVIVGADKDLMQLVTDKILLWDTLRNKVFGRPEVEERFGVPPEKLGDLLALMGDASDNIPGVPSVGPKTAAELLVQFGSLEAVLTRLDEVKKPKLRATLTEHVENARLSRRLVELKMDCPVDVSDATLRFGDASRRDVPSLRRLYETLGFSRQLAALEREDSMGASVPTAPAAKSPNLSLPLSAPENSAPENSAPELSAPAPAAAQPAKTELCLNLSELTTFLKPEGPLALELHTTHPDKHRGPLVGVCLARGDGSSLYVPLSHRYIGAPKQLGIDEVLTTLTKEEREYLVHDVKRTLVLWRGASNVSAPSRLHDSMLASYLLEAEQNHSVQGLALWLGTSISEFDKFAKEGRTKRELDELPVETSADFAGERAATIYRGSLEQKRRLQDSGLADLLTTLEMPLAEQLAEMERLGVLIDVSSLKELGTICETELAALEKQAFAVAGKEFNVNSPRQLETILFDELGLKPIKRTKTSRSTDAATLEALAEEHALPEVILHFRQIAKLKGTYIDSLPHLIDPKDGRVHGAWEQAVAATGRISSTDPNLQNIPIRTELGRKIRSAFIAPPGYELVSADYSQIELRVLAHLSQDEKLLEAFRTNQDIHTRTAMEIFEVTEENVTREMRSQSKAVNFGVIYGQGESGLSKAVGISKADAGRFIAAYFRRYEGVRRYMDQTLESARQGEAVRSILGRHRSVPDIKSGNRARRLAAERIAMNMPIQGSAADILKLAMLKFRVPVTPGARMTLTVHDELVFEVPSAEVEDAMKKIREGMESAYQLSVPLLVSVGHGLNWNSAH